MPRTRSRIYDTDSIGDHARLIARVVDASVRDPETRKLALKIATNKHVWAYDASGQRVPVVQYHKKYYRVAGRRAGTRDMKRVIKNVWNFVQLNVEYCGDIDTIDTYQDLRTTLENGGGDCDDFTTVFAALLRSLGYTVYQKIISVDGEHWAHVYPVVDMQDGTYLPLDATEDERMGWEFSPRGAEVMYETTED